MEYSLMLLVPAASFLALLFAGYLAAKVKSHDEGTPDMVAIAEAIREGARAYLKRQYTGVAIFFAVVLAIMVVLVVLEYIVVFVPLAFVTGGAFSALAGYIGMSIATASGARTANAAKSSLDAALQLAFSSGAVMGLAVVGLGLLDLSVWFYFLNWFYRDADLSTRITGIASTMLNFGLGASSVALFARVGGGIFTKAADVGADLVGKLEAGIPEDDPRNPAVIADNVGDNVGDVAGMGADLYESYVSSIVATSALAPAAGLSMEGIMAPMIVAAIGVLASVIGTFFVRSPKEAGQAGLSKALRKGVWTSSLLVALITFPLLTHLMPEHSTGVGIAVLSGLLGGVLIGTFTEWYTSPQYRWTRHLAETASTGPAPVLIQGLAVGFMSVAPIATVVAVVILVAFLASGGAGNYNLGLFGVGFAAVGMLSTLGITLATDAYGPVADNAGGIAEMTNQDPVVRERTDALDTLGNTTAATGKGFAIGSAALTAITLIAAYKEQVAILARKAGVSVDVTFSLLEPRVLVGVLLGSVLPFVFSAYIMQAVATSAQEIVVEVRRQFREIKGLMEGRAKPDYARCVDICTRVALKEMVTPTLVVVTVPVIVGLILNVQGVAGLLTGAVASGFMLAIAMSSAGGAWDNAKKHIEGGHHGGRGSGSHRAAVIGDTVGDPFKDTAGPSLNILIKLISMVSVVFAPFIIVNHLL
ncbi:MAG: sodium-translocating pyrophosphatase [Firmicutes bacterium]|jgi:K(+)-stimulated pyrophosphate-energized sodium pump|nr:sodium-translocating pyrophosphatase [Bacillota bacterium]